MRRRFITGLVLILIAGLIFLLQGLFSHPKLIALTFDDGPYGNATLQILDILKQEHVSATFFLIGQNVYKEPEIVRREIAEGHIIGNHSFDHSQDLSTMPIQQVRRELLSSEDAIASVTGLHPYFFRPPYGNTSAAMLTEVKRLGYAVVNWDLESRDWDADVPASTIETTIIGKVKPGNIILLHDGRDIEIDYPRNNTIEALPVIIRALKKEGYTFVTVDKLMRVDPYR